MKRALPVLFLLAACSGDGRDAASASPGADAGLADAGFAGDAGAPDASVSTCAEPAYPAGPYGTQVGAVLADRSWTGVNAAGAAGTVSLHDDGFSGCASEPPVLVVRVDAAWCGTCQSYAAHTKTLLAADVGPSVRLLDVVLFDQDNQAATPTDAPRWQAIEDVPTAVAVDPLRSVQDLLPSSTQLPVMLVVDAQTMILRAVLGNPTEDALEQAVRTAQATAKGQPAPTAPAPVLADGRFTRDQQALIAQMALATPPPPDPSDSFADSIPAAALGSKFFVDYRFSPDGMVACNSCHGQLRQFSDGFPTSPDGVGRVNRNSPSLTLSAYTRWSFDDGRADSLWSQALIPLELPNEFGSSRLFVAHAIATYYRSLYQTVFGPLPALDDLTRFPPSGQPGDAAYDAMAPADQVAVTQVFVNVGKSLEAYERTLRGAGATLDAYASGQTGALADGEKDGLLAFFQAGCAQCHYGPRLTDDAFHVLRFPGGSIEQGADPGRQAGIPQLLASAFDLGSSWSDAPSLARPAPVTAAGTFGAFKTPQLRNVALTAPYGHGGNYAQLSDLVELIRTGGLPAGSVLTEGTTEPWVTTFDPSLAAAIVTFLDGLQMQVSH